MLEAELTLETMALGGGRGRPLCVFNQETSVHREHHPMVERVLGDGAPRSESSRSFLGPRRIYDMGRLKRSGHLVADVATQGKKPKTAKTELQQERGV